MIELRDVSIETPHLTLAGISFRVPERQYGVLMGRTGIGKTTILEAICGLRQVTSGAILLNGDDITRLPPGDRGIGYVPQDVALFPTMNVREHLEFALRLQKSSRRECETRTTQLATMLGIQDLLPRSVQGLSGGEAQRVALGRALAASPRVMLLDEPLSALDEETQREMHDLLRKLKTTTHVTTLHVTHNSSEAESLADCRFVMRDGTIYPHAEGSRVDQRG